MGEPDFSLITRSGSISSRKSISALDVGVDDEDNHSNGKLHPLKRKVWAKYLSSELDCHSSTSNLGRSNCGFLSSFFLWHCGSPTYLPSSPPDLLHTQTSTQHLTLHPHTSIHALPHHLPTHAPSPITPPPTQSLISQKSGSSFHRGNVFKLSTSMLVGGGDYVVRGDSSYMAEKSPRWADEEEGGGKERLGRGVWSNVRYNAEGHGSTQVRRLSRWDGMVITLLLSVSLKHFPSLL